MVLTTIYKNSRNGIANRKLHKGYKNNLIHYDYEDDK